MAKITPAVLDVIRKKAIELQRAPLRSELDYRGTFQGGYHSAVLKAGLCPYNGSHLEDVRPPRNGVRYTNEELLGFVHEYVRVHGETPSRDDIPEYGFIEYRFGPWYAVMNSLGYSYESKKMIVHNCGRQYGKLKA